MSEQKKTVRFRVAYFDSEVQPYTETVDTPEQEQAAMRDSRFLCWLTGWQERKTKK